MLLSLSEHPELIITESAMAQAIEMCTKLVGNIRKVTMGRESNGEGTNAERKILLLNELLTTPGNKMTRAELHKKFWMQGNLKEWDDCVATFAEAEIINVVQVGQHIVYEMTAKSIDEMRKFYEGKNK